MYLKYFGFTESPFSIAPNPHFLYLSQRHQEALAHLLYGVSGDGGFVLLTGEVGSGKTTICRCLLEQIPENCDVAYIFNPKLTVEELLSTICYEIGICYPPRNTSIKIFIDFITSHLLRAHAKGRHTVLIIDEAQNLSVEVLEQMRLLTNLETNQRKLLQIILIGQPELAAMLERRELRQLSQRIVARYHLDPLSKAEVAAYIKHRLEVSGGKSQLFPAHLMGRLYRLSSGIPRVINVICDRALLGTYVQGKERVDKATLEQAAHEVLYQTPEHKNHMLLYAFSAALILLIVLSLIWTYQQENNQAAATVPTIKATAAMPPQTPNIAPVTPPSAIKSSLEKTGTLLLKEKTALPDTLEWPVIEKVLPASRALAYTALFQAWGTDYYQGKDPCSQAEGLGLRCYSSRGGLDELIKLNKPAVLQMRTLKGNDFHVTLTALGPNSASFSLGNQARTTSYAALAKQWTGQYTLLWRPPPLLRSKEIKPGERGPAVQWLADKLANAQGRSIDANKEYVFDETMINGLKQFQLAHGLVPDGSPRHLTLMLLAGIGDLKSPSLLTTNSKTSLMLKPALELTGHKPNPPASANPPLPSSQQANK